MVGVYDKAGTKLIAYFYDAWGNTTTNYLTSEALSSTASFNPFTYRGYYYDSSLNLYYLNSRYYDPVTCRFISPEPNVDKCIFDSQKSIVGYNTYVYCINNPINFYDPTGEWTYNFNISLFIGLAAGYSFNIGVSVDSESMIAFQTSYSVPNNEETRNTVIGATIGISFGMQYTDLDSVLDLEGPSKSVGMNTPIGGYDVIKEKYTNEDIGWSIGLGPSIGGDFHVNETQTYTIGEAFRSPMRVIKDWLG